MDTESLSDKYAPEHDPPLGGYALLVVGHLALMGAAMGLLRRRGVELGKMEPGELVLTGVATYKLSRVITKSWIGTAIRAPFTEYVGQGSGDEVEETARGHGLQEAVGDLLTCPFCAAHWVASALVLGHDAAPGPTRAITRILAVDALSDTLQYVRGWLVKKAGD